jgi:hypothetical protein
MNPPIRTVRGPDHGNGGCERAVQALRALLVFSFGLAALEAPWIAEPQPDAPGGRTIRVRGG